MPIGWCGTPVVACWKEEGLLNGTGVEVGATAEFHNHSSKIGPCDEFLIQKFVLLHNHNNSDAMKGNKLNPDSWK
jgi:hypothetical protein